MLKQKSVMIVCSGEDYSSDKIKQYAAKSDYIIACDGGYDILTQCGIKPDVIMGDMDSTNFADRIMQFHNNESGNDVPQIIRFPREKDYTDSELAVQYAKEKDYENIYLFAATGRYVDHSLVNIINIVRNSPECFIVTSNSIISYKTSSFEFDGYSGRRFSLFPIEPIENISLIGAKYQYPNDDLSRWEFSLGNEVIQDSVHVKFNSGSMLFILFD